MASLSYKWGLIYYFIIHIRKRNKQNCNCVIRSSRTRSCNRELQPERLKISVDPMLRENGKTRIIFPLLSVYHPPPNLLSIDLFERVFFFFNFFQQNGKILQLSVTCYKQKTGCCGFSKKWIEHPNLIENWIGNLCTRGSSICDEEESQ